MSLSSHKAYGPKGIGALFVRSGIQIEPIITGGSQESGRRAGTLPPALIAGFGAACEVAAARQENDQARMKVLTERLHAAIRDAHPDMRLFGHAKQRVAGNLNIGFRGVPGEAVVRNVASRIAVSSGSACSSATSEPSRVLLALGLDPDIAATGIRISLGRFTTEEDVDTAVSILSTLALLTSRA